MYGPHAWGRIGQAGAVLGIRAARDVACVMHGGVHDTDFRPAGAQISEGNSERPSLLTSSPRYLAPRTDALGVEAPVLRSPRGASERWGPRACTDVSRAPQRCPLMCAVAWTCSCRCPSQAAPGSTSRAPGPPLRRSAARPIHVSRRSSLPAGAPAHRRSPRWWRTAQALQADVPAPIAHARPRHHSSSFGFLGRRRSFRPGTGSHRLGAAPESADGKHPYSPLPAQHDRGVAASGIFAGLRPLVEAAVPSGSSPTLSAFQCIATVCCFGVLC